MGVTLTLLLAAISTLVCYIIYYRWVNRRYLKMMAKIPHGPPMMPILGHIHLLPMSLEGILDKLNEIMLEYSTPFKIVYGPMLEFVFVSRPEDLQILFNSTDALAKDPAMLRVAGPWFGDGLFLTPDKTKWKNHRKTIVSTFTPKILESFIKIFSKQSNILVECMQKEVEKTEAFNMWTYMMPANFDIVCGTILGISTNSQTQNSPFLMAAHDQFSILMRRIMYFWRLADIGFKCSSDYTRQAKNLKVINDFANKIIHEKRKSLSELSRENKALYIEENRAYGRNPDGKAFLDYLLELTENDPSWTHEDILDEVHFFVAAGYETSATTNCFVLMSLAFHQDIQEKVYHELCDIFGDSDRPPTAEDLNKMTYLDMVIKETLRLYTTIPLNIRHLTADLDLGGHVLPKGSGIIVWPLNVHNNPEYWPNPTKFDPERFLPEEVAKRHPYSYVPFSGGARHCLGYRYAMMSLKTVLSTLLRAYKFTSPLTKDTMKLKIDITLKTKQGFLLNIHPRKATVNK